MAYTIIYYWQKNLTIHRLVLISTMEIVRQGFETSNIFENIFLKIIDCYFKEILFKFIFGSSINAIHRRRGFKAGASHINAS